MNKILIALGVIVLGAGVYWYFMISPKPAKMDSNQVQDTTQVDTTADVKKNEKSPVEIAAEAAKEYSEKYYAQFKYSTYTIATIQTDDGPYDGIIGIDSSGERHDLVPVKSISHSGDWSLYYSFRPGTDAGAWPYFAYNAKTGQLKILLNTTAAIETGYPDKKRISPDGRYILSVWSRNEPHEGTLYKIDWQRDEVTPIHTLAKNETHVWDMSSMTGAIGSVDVTWTSDTVIRYGVFAQSNNIVNTRLRTEILDLVSGEVSVVR